MTSFDKVLIANRGEIARRIARSCHEMGINTVAVYSEADRHAPFVKEADEAFFIGPAPSSESYLRIDKIVEAALSSGAQAVHPGYGFLAENAEFAEACETAGLVFIGPSADTIRLLASKKASKELAESAGVPTVPSFDIDKPESFDYPVLLKASAGGGGKGMHVVHRAEELKGALESATRVAESAFGDSTMLVEKYVDRPRHIEIQILGDNEGNVLHLFERECSIQRRHQKVIEESPAPNLDPALRRRLCDAAIALGKAAGYKNAGTVEFIVAPNGEFYFLEVNTRLQVEHPVTEMVTGIDIVREQIRVAQGQALPFTQEELVQRGSAIECRLYAEDPQRDYLPGSGTLVDWQVPETPGLRVDTGVESGSEISIHYDPMIAKVVCHAETRPLAIAKLRRVLQQTSALGIRTNQRHLRDILGHERFAAGDLDTHFLEKHKDELKSSATTESMRFAALVARVLVDVAKRRRARSLLPALTPGFRNSPYREERVAYRLDGEDEPRWVGYRHGPGGELELRVPSPPAGHGATEASELPFLRAAIIRLEGPELSFEYAGHLRHIRLVDLEDGASSIALIEGHPVELVSHSIFPDGSQDKVAGGALAPMPGKVVKILVTEGQQVEAGQALMVLEAMKMEHSICAVEAGQVQTLLVSEGSQVDGDQLLAVIGTEEQGSP